jgi:AGZA family xanthine/uracil permease-like MFS transporter
VELRAGLTTFLTMAYILFVNPTILGNAIVIEGVNVFGQLLTTTALAAAAGTLMMGLVAKYPFALAPGMGLNAYFAFSVVLGQQIPWQTALGAVFISGLAFLVLSVVGVRELIVNALPLPLKQGISAGIGLFLATIGLVSSSLVVAHPVTLVTLGDPTSSSVLLLLFGLIVIAALMARQVGGAILIGIALTSAVAILTDAPVYQGEVFGGFKDGLIQAPVWPTDLFLQMDVAAAFEMGVLGIVFIFLFVDFFDTAGTLIGLSQAAGFADKRGQLPRASRAFACDAVATTIGAALGTSSTTSYIESAAGVRAGGRTGLTAVAVACLFLISIFFWPLAGAVPAVATAPALIVVGTMMLSGLQSVDWKDPAVAVPVFLTVIGMPLTFSIANGISLGIIAWAAIHLLSGRGRRVHWLMWVLSGLLVARYVWLSAA